MTGDDDLARLLPDPPPPRPARRDAAIAAAMRRFDGVPEPVLAPAAAARPWMSARLGQVSAFASVALVALIAIPLALRNPVPEPQPAPAAAESQVAGGASRAAAPPAAAPAARAPETAAAATPTIAKTGPVAVPNTSARFEAAPPPPAPPPPAPAAKMAAAEPEEAGADIVVSGTRAPAPRLESVSPVTVIASADADEGRDVVVTGSRIARRSGRPDPGRGDWNACTVGDPERALRGCPGLVNLGAKGPAGAAAAKLADGLALAWRGDMGGAIAAFDQAIALQPKNGFAYLNRGLAHQREGNLDEAAADLDRAVRYAPYARSYYNRSLIRRARGDLRGARADEKRAVNLDPLYAAAID